MARGRSSLIWSRRDGMGCYLGLLGQVIEWQCIRDVSFNHHYFGSEFFHDLLRTFLSLGPQRCLCGYFEW
jgi:hypothetical protein